MFVGTGTGTFQTPTVISVQGLIGNSDMARLHLHTQSMAIGDFSGDGKADLIVVDPTLTNQVLLAVGRGDGSFETPKQVGVDGRPIAVAAADVNGDRKADLMVASEQGNTLSLYLSGMPGTGQAGVAPAPAPPTKPALTYFGPSHGPVGTPVSLVACGFTGLPNSQFRISVTDTAGRAVTTLPPTMVPASICNSTAGLLGFGTMGGPPVIPGLQAPVGTTVQILIEHLVQGTVSAVLTTSFTVDAGPAVASPPTSTVPPGGTAGPPATAIMPPTSAPVGSVPPMASRPPASLNDPMRKEGMGLLPFPQSHQEPPIRCLDWAP